jgi:hypothetical protein
MDSVIKYSDEGLKNLNKFFSSRKFIRVGILAGEKNERDSDDASGMNNASIGAVHEFGSMTGGFHGHPIPQRSFIRAPLMGIKNRAEVFKKAAQGFKHGLNSGHFVSFWDSLGAALVNKIQDAFSESGPGWPPLSDTTKKLRMTRHKGRKGGNEKPLIDTGQLRRSISYKVVSE